MDRATLKAQLAQAIESFQTSTEETLRVIGTVTHESPYIDLHDGDLPAQQAASTHLIIMDSSFNPPTTAHMRMALSAAQAHLSSLPPPTVLLLLALRNADKPAQPAGWADRLGMMGAFGADLLAQLGSAPQARVHVGITSAAYFPDKSAGAAAAYAGAAQTVLVGFDTVVRVLEPRYYGGAAAMRSALDGLFARARLRVTLRTEGAWGGAQEQEEVLAAAARAQPEWWARVQVVPGRAAGEAVVSSSEVRRRVGVGEGVQEMVTGRVRAWVEAEGLYVGEEVTTL